MDENEEALLKSAEESLEQYNATTLYAVPIIGLVSYAVYAGTGDSILGMKVNSLETGVILMLIADFLLLYSSRCLAFCASAVETSENPHRMKMHLQRKPGPANPFFKEFSVFQRVFTAKRSRRICPPPYLAYRANIPAVRGDSCRFRLVCVVYPNQIPDAGCNQQMGNI